MHRRSGRQVLRSRDRWNTISSTRYSAPEHQSLGRRSPVPAAGFLAGFLRRWEVSLKALPSEHLEGGDETLKSSSGTLPGPNFVNASFRQSRLSTDAQGDCRKTGIRRSEALEARARQAPATGGREPPRESTAPIPRSRLPPDSGRAWHGLRLCEP